MSGQSHLCPARCQIPFSGPSTAAADRVRRCLQLFDLLPEPRGLLRIDIAQLLKIVRSCHNDNHADKDHERQYLKRGRLPPSPISSIFCASPDATRRATIARKCGAGTRPMWSQICSIVTGPSAPKMNSLIRASDASVERLPLRPTIGFISSRFSGTISCALDALPEFRSSILYDPYLAISRSPCRLIVGHFVGLDKRFVPVPTPAFCSPGRGCSRGAS